MTTAFAHGAGHFAALGPGEILDIFARADTSGIILDSALDAARFEALARELQRRSDELPVLAVESPCPAGRASSAQLCASDRDEARTALEAAEATLRRAATLGARFVVLRLGALRDAEREWMVARDKFLRGDFDERRTRRLVEARNGVAERAVDVARRTLDRLSRTAEAAGIRLLVRNPRRFHELPSPRELDFLLADLAGAPLAPLLDTAAAHLPAEMGVWPLELIVAAFGERAPLVYLGDACGPVGALAPGRGIVDFGFVTGLPPTAEVAFSPWSGLSPDEAVRAVPEVARLAATRKARGS
jgi:hypothetical protein